MLRMVQTLRKTICKEIEKLEDSNCKFLKKNG